MGIFIPAGKMLGGGMSQRREKKEREQQSHQLIRSTNVLQGFIHLGTGKKENRCLGFPVNFVAGDC
jgi:hypothetical protein